MGSSIEEPQLLRRNGELLPSTAFSELKSVVKGQVVVKGEAPEDIYQAAIHRFNNVVIEEAVYQTYTPHITKTDASRELLCFVSLKTMLQQSSSMSRHGNWTSP